jgi:hypothetical protein
MRPGHARPRALVALLERKPFGVRPIAEDHGVSAVSNWTKHIGAQYYAIVHYDRRIPFDGHSVTDLDFAGCHRRALFRIRHSRDADRV